MIHKNLSYIVAAIGILLIAGGAYLYKERKNVFGSKIVDVLPELPYEYDALEPYIYAETMKIHYTKHHQAYVNKLNAALAKDPQVGAILLPELLTDLSKVPEDLRTAVRDNGGGHYNHSFFWKVMTPESTKEPLGEVKELIEKQFGSFDGFKKLFNTAAVRVFGSGWAWLVLDKQGALKIITTENQDCPLSEGLIPLLALDVWEHAYYLKYQNKRAEYIDTWWNVVNWEQVEKNYTQGHAVEDKTNKEIDEKPNGN